MKKNKKISTILTSLLALSVLTTTIVGGTLAYYTHNQSFNGNARVAQAHVNITKDGTIFNNIYGIDDSTATSKGLCAVISDDDIVAPGTNGSFSFDFQGATEVMLMAEYESVFNLNSNWHDAEGNYYCPLEITISTKSVNNPSDVHTTTISGNSYDSVEAFKSAVLAGITYSEYIPAGMSFIIYDPLTVSWSWPFDSENDPDHSKDTYLLEQAYSGNAATVSLGMNARFTQVD